MDYSILIVKPDGLRYLSYIESETINHGFRIVSKYHVYSWDEMHLELNKEEIKKKGSLFGDEIEAHIWLIKYIFGNYAQVWFLEKDSTKDEELLEEIMSLKKCIRDKLNASRNGTFMIISDLNKLGLKASDIEPGFLGTFHNNKFSKIDSYISQEGRFDSFFLKYVHCPDATLEEAKREIEVIKKLNITSTDNLISDEEWKKMLYLTNLM